jgi:hypothetical protein
VNEEKPNRKRRVVVRLTARDKKDPASIMNAVKNALSGHGVAVVFKAEDGLSADAPLEAVPPIAAVPDDELATKARETVEAILGSAAAEYDKKAALARRDGAMKVEEIVAVRKGMWAYTKFWLGQGVRISVQVCEKLKDVAVEAVGGVLGRKKGE